MADKKPDAKKPAGGGGHLFELEVKIIMAGIVLVIFYLALGKYILEALGYGQVNDTSYLTGVVSRILEGFNGLFNFIVFFSVFLILFFTLASIYLKTKHKEVVGLYQMGLQKGYVASTSSTATSQDGKKESVDGDQETVKSGKPVLNESGENKKWDDIQKHMASMNSSDWRMAILEADILLYDMLDQMGYEGDTIADKLKLIEPSDFNTLDLAWRAHKVRNVIAHEGASYELSYEQAQNTIELYKKVFSEFYFI